MKALLRGLLRVAARLSGRCFALLPRRRRFAAARRLTMLLAPLFRRTPMYRRRPSQLDGYHEELLRLVHRSMTRSGVEFDPDLEIRGDEIPGPPAVFVSGHFLLNALFTRWLLDRGHRPVTVVNSPEVQIYSGTRTPVPTLLPDRTTLLRARGVLRDGCSLVVYIDDRQRHEEEGWTAVTTGAGTKYVSDAMMRFAEATDTPLFFVFTRVSEGRVVATVDRAPAQAPDARRAFVERFRAEAEAIVR